MREQVLPAIEARGEIEAWIVDDTSFVKKGVHLVRVARQYCGRLGKLDNSRRMWSLRPCQVGVTLSIANHSASLPIDHRLYLPEDWDDDEARSAKARVRDYVDFQTKPQITLAQLEATIHARIPLGIVLADAAYGSDGGFRAGVTTLGLLYCVGVQSTISLWPPGIEPLPPEPWSGRGREPTRLRRDADHQPVSAKTLAMGLPKEAWRDVSWREGSSDTLTSRFAAIRVRPASGDENLSTPHPFEWLLVEWPEGEAQPTKYWLSTLPVDNIDRGPRRHGQIALAHGARLRGTEERTGPGAFSPLWPSATRRTYPFPSCSIPRRPRSDPNDTSRTPSPPCGST